MQRFSIRDSVKIRIRPPLFPVEKLYPLYTTLVLLCSYKLIVVHCIVRSVKTIICM